MKRLLQKIKNFFLPPEGTPTWQRVLPYAVLGVFTLIILSAGAVTWEYTNSPPFCGETCHTMPPEYSSYQISPHARVACVECHIGKGFITTRITRKAGDLKHVVKLLFSDYEFPIRADDLRPARETCELCHYPEKFSDDSLRRIRRYNDDKTNTLEDIYLSLKTGGGSERAGLGRGIHWHIENPVYFYSADSVQQEIPYVKYQAADGSVKEYIDVESGFDPTSIKEEDLTEMDCITCHNRITHLVNPPENVVDKFIETGEISSEIPDIRRQAVQAYSAIFDSTEMGVNHIAGLEGYYQTYYPDYYAQNQDKIAQAIEVLQKSYVASVFPEQNSSWATHPNNVGHKDFPGCMRCHDGKHLDQENKAIRLECNLCHSIPVVAGQDDFVANLEISRGAEPQSHLNENWISMHHLIFDDTCSTCHTIEDPGGTSNTSFCSNSACHGSVWTYAGFDAPNLRAILESQVPPSPTPAPEGPKALTYTDTIGPLLASRCGTCHGESGQMGLNVTTLDSLKKGSQNGAVIISGDPQNSLIVQKQSGTTPHFSQLTPDELKLLVEWIQAGIR